MSRKRLKQWWNSQFPSGTPCRYTFARGAWKKSLQNEMRTEAQAPLPPAFRPADDGSNTRRYCVLPLE